MKKYLSFAVFALLVAFTSLGLSSCGSDDDDVVNPITGNSMDNDHEYVDLGLPSGLKWATCNVGADSPEAYGTYFAWGETKAKSMYNWSTYSWGTDWDELTKYCTYSSYGKKAFTDTKTILELADDAARANWGGYWRMPTAADFDELLANTNNEWVSNYNSTGVAGCRFTAANGNQIFLPAAGYRVGPSLDGTGSYGYYWSSSLNTDSPGCAYYLYFNSLGHVYVDGSGSYRYGGRYGGRTVRPVLP